MSTSTPETRALKTGYGAVLTLFFAVIVWGVLAPIDSAALAPGVVQVEGKRKVVQHLEGGIVSKIFVENGDGVVVADPLMELDAAQFRADLGILQGRIYNLQALENRLTAEKNESELIEFSLGLKGAMADDGRAAEAISREEILFETRRNAWLGEVEILEKRGLQLRNELSGLEALLESNDAILASLSEEIGDLETLLADGYVDKQRIRDLERSRSSYLGEGADIRAKIASASDAVGENQLKIIQVGKQVKTEVVRELKEVQEQLYDQEQQRASAKDRVNRAVIRAPASGIVLGMDTTTIGAVVGSGDRLLEIVPAVESLVIAARISPMDIDRVRIGQPAEVRFGVFKDAYLISGMLDKISADRLVDGETNTPYYSAEVQLLQDDLYLLEGAKLVPGMPAEVLIKTGERTLLGYITSPLRRLFANSLIEE
ncbi:HlyD family type I secretion periplasmic adaptor subunit [Luminiphilus sp.]|nr:HlyD family type I secretion periplasmic adaptor subunit [Luminiphilus sp.]